MSGTSVPPIAWTETGPVVPQESAIVAGLDLDWTAAFGGTLNTAPTEPAGQMIASQAAIIGDSNDQQLFLYQGVDPAYASGRMQDAIARIYFLERNPAQSTVLQVACGGAVNVQILVGAIISDPSGALYLCTETGTIPGSGTITLPFAAQVAGPLAVPASVAIYQAIPSWDTATLVSGVVGNDVETRSAFEQRREASVAANGAGFLPAIGGAIAKVPNVIDFYVTENSTGSPVTVGAITLAAHSMYACVAGGLAADVAAAIWTKKNPGCAMTGATSVTVQDTNSGYSYPYPSYTIKFQTAANKNIVFLVTMANSATVPANALTLVQGAIAKAFLGEDGGTRARIGSTIFASRFYAGISLLGPWAQIVSILIGTQGVPDASFTGVIAGTALTSSSPTGTIAIGQWVFGTGVADGTRIISGSGTSWVVNISQSVSSEAMTGVLGSANDVAIGIDQEPVTTPGDTFLVLV